ncbi:MAG: hypothetical protein LBT38_00525 [Deltaproteobacteria bacterium]|nr:hypothetical protein [Deltaproteobacteria bacterium]
MEIALDGSRGEPPRESLSIFSRLGWSVQNAQLILGGKISKGYGRFKPFTPNVAA